MIATVTRSTMDNIFFLSVTAVAVILSLLAVQYVRCDDIDIIPTPDSPCPGSIVGQPCFTLQQYATNPTHVHGSEISLKLYPGVHQMDQVTLIASEINSFTMTAAKPASVTVMCSQQQNPNPTDSSYEFIFTLVRTVNISDITFNSCQFEFTMRETGIGVALVRNSFLNNACCNRGSILTISGYSAIAVKVNVTIKQCNFSNNTMGDRALITSARVNLIVYQSNFENNFVYSGFVSDGGGAISHSFGNLRILNSNFTNNEIANNFNGGAIYFSGWSPFESKIIGCRFSGNRASANGGAVCSSQGGLITITNTSFINNTVVASGGHGGAIYSGQLNISNSYFINNRAGTVSGYGGAVYAPTRTATYNVTGSYFHGNRAGGRGGAIAILGESNVTVSNSTFANNTASAGGGGAIYCVGYYSSFNVSLLNSTFNDNTAAYCGAVHMDETYYGSAKVIGSTFTGNRAVGQVAGSNGGGVFCVRNATVTISKSIFTRNSAVGDAGVMQADECDVTITNSFLDKNTAERNGGVLYTYLYPTNYTITQSSFTYNRVGGDGGVMFIGRAGSQVKVKNSTFSYNSAAFGRGGVTAIAGSTLYIGGGSMCKKNSAKLGRVASACKSKVVISNPKVRPTPDPIYSFCSLYAGC